MFSGLIEHRGTVARSETLPNGGMTLFISAPEIVSSIEPKDSICVNGVCLTAADVNRDAIRFDVVPETLARSTLGGLQKGERINLELALRVGDRIGGHFVYGHVDGTARIVERRDEGQGARLVVERPSQIARFICNKGFIALDGVSFTVAAVAPAQFEVVVIPETLRRTTLGERQTGELLNVEVDPLARYAIAAVDGQLSEAELEWAYEI
ncbi:MAG: riboflavin synthase [Candidatus Eremiobacteraeota bacterium]|nr:riboflavin synthase [Candidatus Eremiobacteraeota bacterium]